MLPLQNAAVPHMRHFSARLSTFSDRTKFNTRADPEDFAVAGLYSINKEDYVRCFFCGGGLRKWEFDDDPYLEHAKWYPSCSYIINKKGPGYVNKVARESHRMATVCNGASSVNRTVSHPMNNSPKPPPTVDFQKYVQSKDETASAIASSIAILQQLEERKVCKSCRKCSCNVVFLPCGHLCYCVECSETIYNCPLCKCAVKERIKTFVG